MPPDAYPNDDDLNGLSTAHASLVDHGVQPGPQGYDVATRAAWVYANGWAYGIDRLGGNFRAEIRPGASGRRSFHIVEMGWTADVAMAFALAKALPHLAPTALQGTS